MKTLIISNKYPLPEDNGTNIRTMNFVRFFQQFGEIHIAHRDSGRNSHKGHPFQKEIKLETKHKEKGLKGLQEKYINGIPQRIFYYSPKSEHELLATINEEKYDVILVRYVTAAASLFQLPKTIQKKIIIDVDDLPSDVHKAISVSSIFHLNATIRNQINYSLLKRFEKKCLAFGAALFCSDFDKNKVTARATNSNTHVVPNIIPNPEFKDELISDQRNLNHILFVGTLSYPPNVEGISWFINTIFQEVISDFPDLQLDIVGRNPPTDFEKFCEKSTNVKLHSNVPELEPYYRNCGFVIVPLLKGGGTRIKILEAGLARRPVLSTPLGAHGLNVTSNQNILLFEDIKSFTSCFKSLRDGNHYNFLVKNLENLIKKEYSTTAFNNKMKNVLNSLNIEC